MFVPCVTASLLVVVGLILWTRGYRALNGDDQGTGTTNEGHFSIIGGGLPVWVGGEIVGGIGVSSGSAEQDQLCAEAAIEYFYAKTGMKA